MDEKETTKDKQSYDSALSGPDRAVNRGHTSRVNPHNYMQNDTSTPRSGMQDIHLTAHFLRSFAPITSTADEYVLTSAHINPSETPSFEDMGPTIRPENLQTGSKFANENLGEGFDSNVTESQDPEKFLGESFNSLEIAPQTTMFNTAHPHMSAQAQGESTSVDYGEHVPGIMLVRHTQTGNGGFRTVIRYFPKLSLHRMRQLLQQHHRGQFLVCASGPIQRSLPQSAISSPSKGNSVTHSNGGTLKPYSSNSGGSAPQIDSDIKGKAPDSDPFALYFACPFAKHDDRRYAQVFNPCTLPPGFKEFRRVKEHIHKIHSYKVACPFCKTKWHNPSQYEHEFEQHLLNCPKIRDEGLQSLPEALDSRQLETLETDYRGWSGPDAWKDLFEKLFPDTVAPEPYYNYYILRHRVASWQIRQSPRSPIEPADVSAYTFTTLDHTTDFAQAGMDPVAGMSQLPEPFLEDELSLTGSIDESPERASQEPTMLASIYEPGVPSDCLPAKPQGGRQRDSAYGSMDRVPREHHSREASIGSSQGIRPSEESREDGNPISKGPTAYLLTDEMHEIEFHPDQDEADFKALINQDMIMEDQEPFG